MWQTKVVCRTVLLQVTVWSPMLKMSVANTAYNRRPALEMAVVAKITLNTTVKSSGKKQLQTETNQPKSSHTQLKSAEPNGLA